MEEESGNEPDQEHHETDSVACAKSTCNLPGRACMQASSDHKSEMTPRKSSQVPASPTKSIKSPGSTISASRSRRNLLDDDEAAQNLRTYQKRIDSIQGVTPKMSLDIRQDFKIEDRIGQLAGVLCANEKLLPRHGFTYLVSSVCHFRHVKESRLPPTDSWVCNVCIASRFIVQSAN